MANNSGVKGDNFERFVAKQLNEIYKTQQFKKTPGSGALVGLSNFGKNLGLDEQVLKTLGSDIIVPDWFPFSVECKWYKDSPNYATILKGRDNDLDRWLGETLYDAINFELIPILLFKTNNKGVHVTLPAVVFNEITSHTPQNYLIYGEFVIFGFEHLTFIAEELRLKSETFLRISREWYGNSEFVKDLLQHMKKSKQRVTKSRNQKQ